MRDDIIEVIKEVFDTQEVETEKSLADSLGVDSTEIVELRVALNKKLGIDLKPGDISNKHSPSQIIEIIEKKKSGI